MQMEKFEKREKIDRRKKKEQESAEAISGLKIWGQKLCYGKKIGINLF